MNNKTPSTPSNNDKQPQAVKKTSPAPAKSAVSPEEAAALKHGEAVRKRNSIIAIVCGVIFVVLLIWILRSGNNQVTAKIQDFISRSGIFGPIFFVAISVFTSYIPIIPMGSMGSIGIVVFGPLLAFFLNTVTSYINCTLAFFLARHYGTKMLYQVASPATISKYETYLRKSKHFELVFFIWMMLPVSPDILLCMLAGLTEMKVSHFLGIILISRPFSSWCYSTGMLEIFNWLRKAVHL